MTSGATARRAILHVDMDAFFTSVEQRDNPALRGKPVLVGGTGPRSVVAAASYEARRYGCHSAQPMSAALRMCPNAVVVSHSLSSYSEISREIFEILREFTPLVQPVSIDEAYLDVTASIPLLGEPVEMARAIRARIFEATSLTASVGVAHNKFLAKLASDLDKPDGLTVIDPDRVHEILDPLPVGRIHGVGPSAERALGRLGVRTIGELRRLPREVIASRMGSHGLHAWTLACGIDDRPVHTGRERKSVGHERTFDHDLISPDQTRSWLTRLAEDTARRLRSKGLLARAVTLKIRYGSFETITRTRTLDDATDDTRDIAGAASDIFESWITREGYKPVRLIGVTTSGLTPSRERQLRLFEANPGSIETDGKPGAKSSTIDILTDTIARRFGEDAIRRARAINAPKPSDNEDFTTPRP